MTSSYLLALDLGTSSIGYVAFSLDEAGKPIGILDLGVRVFSDGRDPKTKEPLAVGRRKARGIRRTRDRGQNRVRRLVKELIEFGLLPEDDKKRKTIFDSICPYEARAKAADEHVDKETLGRAIFHLGRRRGFKSNRLAGDEEESDYKNKISNLKKTLGDKTLGQYLFGRLAANQALAKGKTPIKQHVIRFRNGETEFYADRDMYKDEFERIRQTQGNKFLNDDQWAALYETAFWQYPLKPAPKGKCRFYPSETRAHIDLPMSHDFRVYQEVNALRYVSGGKEFGLDDRQRLYVYKLLNSTKIVPFKSLAKKKDGNKSPYFPSDANFNLDVASRNGKLHGNRVMCDLRKPELLGELADSLPYKELNNIIHHLIEPLKERDGKKVVIENEELEKWLKRRLPQLSEKQVSSLCKYRFKRDTASVSRKFMGKVSLIMRETGKVYSDAVAHVEDEMGHTFHHSYFETGEVFQKLPYYGRVMPESVWGDHPESDKEKGESDRDIDAYEYGKIANPTVHVALNQLRFVVNRIIDSLGSVPDRIHVELTRDLKNSKDARDKIQREQGKNKKENDRIRAFLKDELGINHPRREDIQKMKLWEELGGQGARRCVFTNLPISCKQLFSGEVEIEHIIPFSRCYDDGMSNKTLAFKSVNNEKLNKTPHEAFGHDEDRYAAILSRALGSFKQGSKYDRFKEGAFESFYGGEKGDMIERQLNDTKYISRKARQYLSCLVTSHNVISVNGRLTALLRDVWQLNHFKDKESGHYRDDHRHHIVDAFVVGLTSRSLIQQLSRRRSISDQTVNNMYQFLKSHLDDIPELKRELFNKLDDVVASYKPDHTQTGSMFNDTAYGIERDQNGDQWCVTRKAVAALSHDEIFRIRDGDIRERLMRHVSGRPDIENKRELKKAVTEKEFEIRKQSFSESTGIKTLRINIPNNSVKPIKSAPYKGYARNSYAFCDVWKVPHQKDKNTGEWTFKYQGDFVAYADIREHDKNQEKNRPHPAAKKIMRLYKDDCIQTTHYGDGKVEYLRVAGYSSSNNKIDIRPNLQANNPGQNYISINGLFSDRKIKKIKV